jgi:pSer/pThr/pTyr-binding forkhead associated (FHA) protein
MPKLIVSIDGVVLSEMQLTKDRTTLGRRPYNDIVIDNLAVSGEHAVFRVVGTGVQLQDLNSTNGTYVNGKPVKKQYLNHDDVIEIGKCRIQFLAPTASSDPPAAARPTHARVEILNGSAAGKVVLLTKSVTTLGRSGVSVVAISETPDGYAVEHVEGESIPTLNGNPIATDLLPIKHGDVLDLAGTDVRFLQA